MLGGTVSVNEVAQSKSSANAIVIVLAMSIRMGVRRAIYYIVQARRRGASEGKVKSAEPRQ